jgi:hypothetical protein
MGVSKPRNRNGPPPGRAARSIRFDRVGVQGAGARPQFHAPTLRLGTPTLPAHSAPRSLRPTGAVEGLVHEVVVVDGFDAGIFSHIGLLCWIV